MPKKSAAKSAAQADLLSNDRGLNATVGAVNAQKKNEVANVEAKPKGKQVAKAKSEVDHKPGTLLSIIKAVIENPNVPAEKVQMFFDMQMKAEAEEARRSFTRSKLTMRPLLPVINKDGKIEIPAKDKPGGGKTVKQVTPYATFENIMSKIDQLLQQHGFDLYFTTEATPDGSRIIVIGHLDHVDGHSVTTSFPLPAETSGSKNNVQGWMSALSYGKRGDTVAILNLRTSAPEDADRDGVTPKSTRTAAAKKSETKQEPSGGDIVEGEVVEGETVEVITKQQLDTLIDAIEDCGAGRDKVLKHYSERLERQLKSLAELPASLFDNAMTACRNYSENQKGKAAHG